MDFCVIAPTSGLQTYAARSKHHMVLANIFARDPAYAEFYLNRREAGEFIFLDNGVYEGAYDPKSFLEVISALQPNVAVLPDIICGGPKSTARSSAFYLVQSKAFPRVNWMFIPQGATLLEWQVSLSSIRTLLERTPSIWIGLTRFLTTHVCRGDHRIRVKLARTVRSNFPATPIHCMGMANGSVKELKLLAEEGIVSSCDSSAPVWRGWQGYTLTKQVDKDRWNRKGNEVDFAASLLDVSKSNFQLIERNLKEVANAVAGV